jgi:twitching motility protein PilT
MLANKLFPLLAKPEVQELVLHSGKPPCALVSGTFRRLSAQVLREEDILAVIMAARGQEHAPRLADGVQWEFSQPGVGKLLASARYEGPVLRLSLKLAQSRSAQEKPAAPAAEERAVPLRGAAEPAPREVGGQRRPDSAETPQVATRPDPRGLEPLPLRAAAAPSNDPVPRRASSSSQQLAAQAQAGRAQPNPLAMALDEPWAAPPARTEAPARPQPVTGDSLDVLLTRAREIKASDLHVLADRPATLRIAGDLVPQPEVFEADKLERQLLERIPDRARQILERDGSCDFSLVHPSCGRFRANVGRQRTGMKLTARPIASEVPTLEELGLPESIAAALEHHQGLIVITGATGHGKTTTLASLVGILNRETSHHVITVEDPIEFVHETAKAVISQREVGTHTKTFAAALKGALREDPDVIVVGELRDTETVRMALSASETGHLVISTMNTPSAAKAIERLIDLFPPGDQPQVRMTLAGGLRLIISQRLVPSADRKQLRAAVEVLPGSTPLWSLIRENRTYQIASLQQRGKSLGIIRLDDSLAELVRSGKTSLEIAKEYADSAELLETLVSGRPLVVRPDAAPENQNDPANSLQKRGAELGKQVLSRAGKLFGGENK